MKIVEIGCGSMAGPYIESANVHYISDISEVVVNDARHFEPRFIPLAADASDLSQLDDASIDIVLARNVFGDPQLGHEATTFRNLLRSGDATETLLQIERKKLEIVQEAARILLTNGRLVIVEQYTPSIARRFVTKLEAGILNGPEHLTLPQEVDLETATSFNYANHHKSFGTIAWQAVKIH